MRKEEKFTGNIDWLTVLLYLILCCIGLAAIYSSIYVDENSHLLDWKSNSGKQVQWMIGSFVVAAIILIVDGKFFATFSYIIYGLMLPVIVGVIFLGVEVKGQQNWIRIGGFQMQPSELVKFSTSLAIAKYLSTLNVDIRKWRDKWKAFALIGFPMLIILIQGDTGSAVVFAAFSLVLFREGLESYFLIIGVVIAVLSVLALLVPHVWYLWIAFAVLAAIVLYFNYRNRNMVYLVTGVLLVASLYVAGVEQLVTHLPKHQRDRINVLLGKESKKDLTWNVDQSMIAIGSGGLTGKGYLQGPQTHLKYVPEQSTDFIFSCIGEEFGFLGTLTVVALFLVLLLRLISLAEKQRSKYSRVYGYCVAAILFFHFAVNIGMAIGVAPVIGIPLPFISKGGSSLLSFTILLFIFIRLDSQRLDVLR
ncbi:MAG: rod shape-determining protein RodA [Chitinophagales bacterium]